ncbi:MAG: DUF5698 domain-containing protein [Peptococcaceae bacterium]|jgi:uncharacterized protein YebE (UPF0316 family)|nr:DUF5698 domain-containing protein [Peptococcaceae bacterium]
MSAFFLEHVVLGYIFICLCRICDVTLQTTRTILVVRGERLKAAVIGFFEVIIYVLVLNAIFNNLDNLGNLISYALGFASGNFVGGIVEEKLAIGIQHIQVITMKEPIKLAELLREQGFGITVLEGSGRSGPTFVLQTLLERKHAKSFSRFVADWDENVFMIISDAKQYRGGVVRGNKNMGAAYAKKGK